MLPVFSSSAAGMYALAACNYPLLNSEPLWPDRTKTKHVHVMHTVLRMFLCASLSL